MRRRSKRKARRNDLYDLPGWTEYLQTGSYVPLLIEVMLYLHERGDQSEPRDYIVQQAAEAAEHLGIEYAQQT